MEPFIFIAIALTCSIGFIISLIFVISPMSFYNLFRINYYLCWITENGTVIKRLIQRSKGQWFLVWQKRAYLIPFNAMVRHKSGNIFYADIHNAFSIKCLTQEQQALREEIMKEPRVKGFMRARVILNKIPVVGMFVQMKKDVISEVVFANRFVLNPDFIVDSCQFYIMLTQDITKKILAKPKSLADVIAEFMPFIIVGIVICVIVALYIQGNKGGVQT
jgi:hypothetical protein